MISNCSALLLTRTSVNFNELMTQSVESEYSKLYIIKKSIKVHEMHFPATGPMFKNHKRTALKFRKKRKPH